MGFNPFTSSGGSSVLSRPGYVAANWYLPYSAALAGGAAVGNGTIRFIPFTPAQSITIDTLGIRTATAGTTNIQLAIYASQTTAGDGPRPTGNALSSTASIVNTGANTSLSAALGADVALTAGSTYFLGLNCNDATMTAVSYGTSNNVLGVLLGADTQSMNLGSSVSQTHLSFAQTFGTWPDMTSNLCTDVSSAAFALIQFKVKSVP